MTNPVAAAELSEIAKKFNGMAVLAGASLDLFEGEILGLVGPNGSGKTTLVNILCGIIAPDAGEIRVGNNLRDLRSPVGTPARDIRLLPQSMEIYPTLSVLENIFVGQEITKGWGFLKLMDWKKMEASATALLDRVDARGINISGPIVELSGGQQKSVGLARLLAGDGRILVFDEPTTALGVEQKALLFDLMTQQADEGRAIVFISHEIDDLLDVCDRIVGLRHGRIEMNRRREDIDRATLVLQMSAA